MKDNLIYIYLGNDNDKYSFHLNKKKDKLFLIFWINLSVRSKYIYIFEMIFGIII